jgi:predicted transglutaminase-like cysteine proteinase
MHALRTRSRQAPLRGAWVRRALLLVCFLGTSLAAPNLDKTQSLALERYGKRAADTVAAWRRMLEEVRPLSEPEKLDAVNAFFNSRILFEDDMVVWQQADYWASPLEFMGRGAGDCEDFAIAKYMSLLLLGMPNERLRMIYVRAHFGGPNSRQSQAHMVLGYYAQPLAEPLILDNLIGNIRPAAQRADLTPVFSFNNEGLWVQGATASAADPTARLSRWRGVLERMKQEGL